jgi:hypothetical protein
MLSEKVKRGIEQKVEQNAQVLDIVTPEWYLFVGEEQNTKGAPLFPALFPEDTEEWKYLRSCWIQAIHMRTFYQRGPR